MKELDKSRHIINGGGVGFNDPLFELAAKTLIDNHAPEVTGNVSCNLPGGKYDGQTIVFIDPRIKQIVTERGVVVVFEPKKKSLDLDIPNL